MLRCRPIQRTPGRPRCGLAGRRRSWGCRRRLKLGRQSEIGTLDICISGWVYVLSFLDVCTPEALSPQSTHNELLILTPDQSSLDIQSRTHRLRAMSAHCFSFVANWNLPLRVIVVLELAGRARRAGRAPVEVSAATLSPLRNLARAAPITWVAATVTGV